METSSSGKKLWKNRLLHERQEWSWFTFEEKVDATTACTFSRQGAEGDDDDDDDNDDDEDNDDDDDDDDDDDGDDDDDDDHDDDNDYYDDYCVDRCANCGDNDDDIWDWEANAAFFKLLVNECNFKHNVWSKSDVG